MFYLLALIIYIKKASKSNSDFSLDAGMFVVYYWLFVTKILLIHLDFKGLSELITNINVAF